MYETLVPVSITKTICAKGRDAGSPGQIIRELAINDIRLEDLQHQIKADARFESALVGLLTDGLVTQTDDLLHLTKPTSRAILNRDAYANHYCQSGRPRGVLRLPANLPRLSQ